MKQLYIIVEGETELAFVNKLLIPYFVKEGIYTNIQGIMITMKGGGHGFNNMEHLVREIKPFLFLKNEPFVSTMIDYYGINSEKKMPNYLEYIKISNTNERIEAMENEIKFQVDKVKNSRFFIPNILKHEMETLFFANPESFEIDSLDIKNDVLGICNAFSDIEEINDSPLTAPSKRLISIYEKYNQKYQKITNGITIAELTGIEDILQKCKRFKKWVDNLIFLLKTNIS